MRNRLSILMGLLCLLGMAGGAQAQAVYVPPSSVIQPETASYLARVSAAGGNIDGATVDAIDRFVEMGKQGGWWSAIKQCWVPAGDFVASKVFLVTPAGVAPTFYNFVSSDYSQSSGYALTSNSSKYIDTGFAPNNQGVTSQNFSMGFCTLADGPYTTGFAFLLGTSPVSGTTPPSPFVDIQNGGFGISGETGLNSGYGAEATAVVGHYGASAFGSAENGALLISGSGTSAVAMATNVTIYRSQRENNTTYYMYGAVGFYCIGTDIPDAQCVLMTKAINVLMLDLGRNTYRRSPALLTFGDSITQGTGATGGYASTQRWGKLLATMLGMREQNTAQGSSQTTVVTANPPYVAAINRYATLLDQPGMVAMLYGTNDIGADSTTTPTTTLVTQYQSGLSSIIAGFQSSNHRVLVGGPPYRTGWATTVLTAYEAAAAAAAKTNNAPFADLYDALVDTGSPSSYLMDGTHPNTAGHALVAQYMLWAARGQLVRKPTLAFPSIAAGSSASLTVTVYNAVAGQAVTLGLPTAVTAGLIYNAFVSANDTVTVQATNATASAITPASQQFTVTVQTPY